MADYSAVALPWFQAATDLTPPTEEECRRFQEVWQEREQLLQMRDLLQVQVVRLISSTTQSHEEVQALMRERRWLLNELASFRSTDEVDARSQFSQLEQMQTNGHRPISPAPEEVPWARPCSQRCQHRSTNSEMSTPQTAPTPVSWTAMDSIPGHHQQPGPEEIPWPQPRPQLMQRTWQNAGRSEAAPTRTRDAMILPQHGGSRLSRTSPPHQQHRSVVQPATDNNSPRRPLRNAQLVPVTPPQPLQTQVAFTADLPLVAAQFARNHQSELMQANQQLQAPLAQRPFAQSANSAPSARISNIGGTIGLVLPSLPTAAPAA